MRAKQLSYGEEGESARGRGGRFGWNDRMAAFTQRVVSPAETHFTVQHNSAVFRCYLQLISRLRGQRFVFASSGLFCYVSCFLLMPRAWVSLQCPLRMDRLFHCRRTKRIKPLQRTASFQKLRILVSIVDSHLSSSSVFLVSPCV